MIIYTFNPTTGESTGQMIAPKCPVTGADVFPAWTTPTPPPEVGENQVAKYVEAFLGDPAGHWVVEDGPVPEPEPEPTPEEMQSRLTAAVQAHMDTAAGARGYDDIKSAVTYADEPAVPKFAAEGQAYRAWRSLVWAYCYEQLDRIQRGIREDIPTPESIITELPALNLPE